MSCQRVLRLLAALFVALAFAGELRAQPDDAAKEKASARFQKGVELYNDGDIRAALIEFRRAYELAPTYRLLFNMGQASAELKEYVEAHNSFTQYLRDGGEEISEDRRAMVEREIARLKSYLARLELTISVPAAEVAIDAVVVGVSPLEGPLLVSAGRRGIVVTRTGYARWERFVDLAGEDEKTIAVDMISLAPVSTPGPTTRPPRRDGSGSGLGGAFWASAAVTAAFAIGTGVAGALTIRAESDYDLELAKVPNTQASIDKAADKVKRFALFTDIGLGLTAVGLVTTIVVAVTSGGSDSDIDEAPLGLSVGVDSVGLCGRF